MAVHQQSRHGGQADQWRWRQYQHEQGGFKGVNKVGQGRLSVNSNDGKIMPTDAIFTGRAPAP
jgi:hypothetical protein